MKTTHRLAAAFVCLVACANQAWANGPTGVEFKNYTADVVTVYIAARTGTSADGNQTREINGPYTVKPGETQSMFKAEGGDLEHVLVCVLCDIDRSGKRRSRSTSRRHDLRETSE
jgi:hypothetical protein